MFAYQGIYSKPGPKVAPVRRGEMDAGGAGGGGFFGGGGRRRDDGRTMSAMSRCSFTDYSVISHQQAIFMKRNPSMIKDDGYLIPRLPPGVGADHLTIILDLDETLAYRRGGPLKTRPHLTEFLTFLAGINCEVVVWTAGLKSYAQQVVATIDPQGVIAHCVYRHSKWYPSNGGVGTGGDSGDERCCGTLITKNLALTGRCPNRTLIIDNTPDCIMHNALNGIVCRDFTCESVNDKTLVALKYLIADLVASGKHVPEFITSCPDLRLLTVCDNHNTGYQCYFLDESRWGGPSCECDKTQCKLAPTRAKPLQL